MKTSQIQKGEMPLIGVSGMIATHNGWTEGDGTGHEGYNVADYFDVQGRYKGPDGHGIEPTFRDMTPAEIEEYIAENNLNPMPR